MDDAINYLYGLALANRLAVFTLAEVVRIWPDKMTYNVAYRRTDGKRHNKDKTNDNISLHISFPQFDFLVNFRQSESVLQFVNITDLDDATNRPQTDAIFIWPLLHFKFERMVVT